MSVQAKLTLMDENGIPLDALNVFDLRWRLQVPWKSFRAGTVVYPQYWGSAGFHLLVCSGHSRTMQAFSIEKAFAIMRPDVGAP